MLKLKTCTLLEILDPVIAMMPKRVQHFIKLQAMALRTAQELTWAVSTTQQNLAALKSIVFISNFALLLLRVYICQTASPWVTTNVGQ
jgi:hypothetical protein